MTSVRVGGVVAAVAALAALLGVWQGTGGASSQSAQAYVALSPPSQVVNAGATVTVDVSVANVTNLAGWEVRIKYDKAVLEYASFAPSNGFLSGSGREVSCPAPFPHNDFTEIQFGCGSIGPTPPGVAGSGKVGTVTFTAKATGESDLEIVKLELANPNGSNCCGVPSPQEAVVQVVSANANPEDEELPPTATPNARKLTPTVPAGAESGENLVLSDDGQSSPGAAGSSGSGASPSRSAGRSNAGREASGGTAGAQSGNSRGAPVAGTGAASGGDSDRFDLLALAVMLAVAGGSLITMTALARRRQS
jgi:hypothetical protein